MVATTDPTMATAMAQMSAERSGIADTIFEPSAPIAALTAHPFRGPCESAAAEAAQHPSVPCAEFG